MNAIILAAGRGGRLQGVIGDRPKCLARVGDRTLLERQVATLQAIGISRITVVAGYGIEHVRRTCSRSVEIVENPQFAATNSLYSLSLVSDRLQDGFVVMNCDVLFHPQMLEDLLTARCADALLVASRADGPTYGDEEMKVSVRRGLITAISKTLDPDDCDGENVGIARFSATGARVLTDILHRTVAAGELREWLPRAFGDFAAVRPLRAIDTRGYPWIEIDFPEDYWRACSDVLPAIDGDAVRPAVPPALLTARTVRHV
ncbi:MAG: phosphocholine cytidylyltransferase family protein [Acidobacteria bacterium]|nr:phosphocholine cytidylyltransferase family protein [Acidobacteriota bacterium]